MAIYRSLRTIIGKNSNQSRSFVIATSTTSFSIPNPYGHLPSNPLFQSNSNRFIFPLSKWITPFQGPLFLSRTPWKLSQSSTPLFLRRGIVLRKVQALNLNLRLLQSRQRKTIELVRAASVSANPILLDRADLNGQTQDFLQSFVNWPNIISMSRVISGPFLGWMIVNEWYSAALVGLAISGATDWLDGYVARKMNINSVVGSYLDPLADKVLIGCVALAMVHNDLLSLELVGIVVLRDVGLVGGAVYKRASDLGWQWQKWSDFFNLDGTRPVKVEPLYISKVNTVLQLVLVAAALLQPEFGTIETQSYITYLSWLVASTTIGSTAAYGVQFMKRRSITMRP